MYKHGSTSPFWYTEPHVVAKYRKKARIKRKMQRKSRKLNFKRKKK